MDDDTPLALRRERDGRSWRIGTTADCSWISSHTTIDVTITSAIPPVFDAYATVVVPAETDRRTQHEAAVLELLAEQSAGRPWWLGYLETGADDVVFPDAPRAILYANWPYVVVAAGPEQAAGWRAGDWRGPLPDLMFPEDHSWLISWLWDDDWRCLGGPTDLIDRFARDSRLDVRPVELGADATPPGHQSR